MVLQENIRACPCYGFYRETKTKDDGSKYEEVGINPSKKGAVAGAAIGASIGSFAGPLGTVVGGIVGGIVGGVAGPGDTKWRYKRYFN